MVGMTAAAEEKPKGVDPLSKEEADVLEKEGSQENDEGKERPAPPCSRDLPVDLAIIASSRGPAAPCCMTWQSR